MDTLCIIASIAALTGLLYAAFVIYFTIGWLRMKTFATIQKEFTTDVSVIIPARNEEWNIGHILKDIAGQDYPFKLFELIVVDDHSTDGTAAKVREFISFHPEIKCNIIHLAAGKGGKKAAISEGIQNAFGSLLVTTDADCRAGRRWLSSIMSLYETKQPKMIAGPVVFQDEKSIFSQMQSLEFLGLIGTTAGALGMKNPVMCNGANLTYEKEAFYEAGGFEGVDTIASGDDVLLMLKFKKRFRGKVAFLKSTDAVVLTPAQPGPKGFISQRRRWASKNRMYKDTFVRFTAIVVWLACFSILLTGILSLVFTPLVEIFIALFTLKCIIDFLFLLLVASFFGRRSLLLLIVPGQFLYVIYVMLIGLSSFGGAYQWKGRKVR